MNGPQTHDALCALRGPAHPREFQSIVDEVTTCPFNHSAANGIALCETYLVPYVFSVPLQVSDDWVERVFLGIAQVVLGQHLLESADNSAGCSPQGPF